MKAPRKPSRSRGDHQRGRRIIVDNMRCTAFIALEVVMTLALPTPLLDERPAQLKAVNEHATVRALDQGVGKVATNVTGAEAADQFFCWYLNGANPESTCYTKEKSVQPKGAGGGPHQWAPAMNGGKGPEGSMVDCNRVNPKPCEGYCIGYDGHCENNDDCCDSMICGRDNLGNFARCKRRQI